MDDMTNEQLAALIEGSEVTQEVGVPIEQSWVEARQLATGKVAWTVHVVIGATDEELRVAVDQARTMLAHATRRPAPDDDGGQIGEAGPVIEALRDGPKTRREVTRFLGKEEGDMRVGDALGALKKIGQVLKVGEQGNAPIYGLADNGGAGSVVGRMHIPMVRRVKRNGGGPVDIAP